MEETKGLTIPTVGHATKELETVMDGQTPTAMATPPHPEVPAPLNAYLSKAKFYFKASKFEEALKECRKVRQLEPNATTNAQCLRANPAICLSWRYPAHSCMAVDLHCHAMTGCG
jgi:hypothetical protein